LGDKRYKEEGKIGLDTYIEIGREGEAMDFILVSSPKYEKELGLTDIHVNEIFGKTVGDTVTLEGKKWQVRRVISKYAWLFLQSISITSGQDQAEPNPTLEELRAVATTRETAVVGTIQLAVVSRRFMELLAFDLQTNLAHFWRKITTQYNVPIFAIAFEADRATLASSMSTDPLLFDISSLVTLHEENLWSIVDQLDNPKFITFSVVRILDEYISALQLSMINGDRRLYSIVGGALVEELLTVELQQAEEQRIRDLRKQILDRFEVVEGDVPEDYQLYLQNVQQLGRCNFDALLAAQGKNMIFITDDAFLREWLSQQFPVRMRSVTHILFHLVAIHKITTTERDDAFFRLLGRNFYNIPVSGQFFFYLFRREKDSVGTALKRATISLKGNPIGISISIFFELLRLIFRLDQISLAIKQQAAFDVFQLFFALDSSLASKTLFSNQIDLDESVSTADKNLLNEALQRAYELKNEP
jgi:hypothetical protein